MTLEALATRYRSSLLAFFNQRTANIWDAEELTQDVFLKILNCQMTEAVCREPYVITVAWSVLRDRNRRNLVRQRDYHIPIDENNALTEAEDPNTPDRIVDAQRLCQLFWEEVKQLNPRERLAFIEHRFGARTYRQIARQLGVSESAVEKYMTNALARLRKTARTYQKS